MRARAGEEVSLDPQRGEGRRLPNLLVSKVSARVCRGKFLLGMIALSFIRPRNILSGDVSRKSIYQRDRSSIVIGPGDKSSRIIARDECNKRFRLYLALNCKRQQWYHHCY